MSTGNGLTKIKKILSLVKSFTPEEIKLFKNKHKKILQWALDRYAKDELTRYPPLKDFIWAVVDLLDAMGDEALISESIKLIVEGLEIMIDRMDWSKLPRNQQEAYQWGIEYGPQIGEILVREMKSRGFESRLLKLARDFASHLNRLAGEEDSQISDADEAELMRKLQEAKTESKNQSGDPTEWGTSLGLISPTVLISSANWDQQPGVPRHDRPFDYWELAKEWEKINLNITETTPKWYERTWLVVLMVVSALIIGGFISWLFFRRKEKPFQERED